ncbi:MAG: hypothetical protein JKX94_04920 [Sneathiella sp.]|nr:hypothetical protein [Sneathiella sp.]
MNKITKKDETELLRSFKMKGVGNGQELIIYKQFCLNFIKACKQAELAIIGIDGFYILNDGSIRPNLDEIADFSDVEAKKFVDFTETCNSAAVKFIRHMLATGKSDGYCFTLTNVES